ncbi:GntR family transcriptional regulator [Sciscionella marina]|uniref:GntR family transcriptional regulator n=1 Tax=Sciscionella marina TaxID=508770 RepID=UPI0003750ADF|nr:GntR family transcriptional regulator [Sciscionella marina]
MSGDPAEQGGLLGKLPEYASLREQALRVIRTGLIAGRIKQGEIYSASALAAELGVSTSPVREALLTLTNEGLMEAVRNRGFRVVPTSERDLEEVYELRLMLEVPGMRRVAERREHGELSRFGALVEQNKQAAAAGEVHGFLDTDQEFHLGLLALAGNRRLVDTVRALRMQARLYGVGTLAARHQLEGSAQEHADILDAVAAGDGAATERLMRRHLAHTRGTWATGDPLDQD